jgi:hypothetical protein
MPDGPERHTLDSAGRVNIAALQITSGIRPARRARLPLLPLPSLVELQVNF